MGGVSPLSGLEPVLFRQRVHRLTVYTLFEDTSRTALDILGEDARVVVAELVPAVVEWNRGVLADLAGRPLDDRRTELREADVVQLITATRLERIKNFRIAVRSSILIPCGLLL